MSTRDLAEKNLIGTLLSHGNQYIPLFREQVSERDFSSSLLRALWRAAERSFNEGWEFTLLSASEALSGDPQASQGYSMADVTRLSDSYSMIIPEEEFPKAVATIRQHQVKEMIMGSVARAQEMIAGGSDPIDVAQILEEKLRAAQDSGPKGYINIRAGYALLDEFMDGIAKGVIEPAIPTGWREIDRMTGGLGKGEMWILGARPGVGKTSFGLTLVDSLCSRGYGVGFFELEMRDRDVMQRLASIQSGVPYATIRSGKIPEADLKLYTMAKQRSDSWNMQLSTESYQPLSSILPQMRRMVIHDKVSVVVIDYLGLINFGAGSDSRRDKISHAAKVLRNQAKDLGITLILMSQLNRESPEDPKLWHLRESGALEEDADVVLLLNRDIENTPSDVTVPHESSVTIAKDRKGSTGKLYLNFSSLTTAFTDQ